MEMIELLVVLGLALIGAYMIALTLREKPVAKGEAGACEHEWDTWSSMRESDLVFYQIRDCKHCNFAEVHMVHK